MKPNKMEEPKRQRTDCEDPSSEGTKQQTEKPMVTDQARGNEPKDRQFNDSAQEMTTSDEELSEVVNSEEEEGVTANNTQETKLTGAQTPNKKHNKKTMQKNTLLNYTKTKRGMVGENPESPKKSAKLGEHMDDDCPTIASGVNTTH